MTRHPRPADIVMVRAAPALCSGLAEAPAIVTAVAEQDDGQWLVGLRVLLHGVDVTPAKVAVPLYASRADADRAVPARTNTHVAWWPGD